MQQDIAAEYKGLIISLVIFLTSCQNDISQSGIIQRPSDLAQTEAVYPVNSKSYHQQIKLIKEKAPRLYAQNKKLYEAIDRWLEHSKITGVVPDLQIATPKKIQLTAYYTPIMTARKKPDNEFRYPLYRFPGKMTGVLPTRVEIYAGALQGKQLEIGYTKSLIDNFMLHVQGSGYVDFGHNVPRQYFAFAGKNGHPYRSIGRLLVELGALLPQQVSMQTIKEWAKRTDEKTLISLLGQNPSFIFFTPQPFKPVVGSAGVPLVAKTAVASDPAVIPTGTVLLTRLPILNAKGEIVQHKEWRLLVALDKGSAVKGYHLDVYQGIGNNAGQTAGYYNHFGWARILKLTH